MIDQKSMSFRSKLMLVLLLLGLFSAIILVGVVYQSGKTGLTQNVFNHLHTVRATKKYQIEQYFDYTSGVVEVMSSNPTIIKALKDFKAGFHSLDIEELDPTYTSSLYKFYNSFLDSLMINLDVKKDIDLYFPSTNKTKYLQYQYIINNPHPKGKKNKYISAKDVTPYNTVHEQNHNYLNKIVEEFHFYDIFLVDLETGDIVYTAHKETDFGTNLYEGPYSTSNLAELADQLKHNRDLHQPTLVDYQHYRPSYGVPASFMGIAITENSQTIGALIVQLPVSQIDEIMTGNYDWKEDGLGNTGETYLVGEDCLMRSVSRFFLDDTLAFRNSLLEIGKEEESINNMYTMGTTILNLSVKTQACIDALAGQSNTKVIDDYRGIPVLSSYAPLHIRGLRWAILSELDLMEANSSLNTFKRNIFVTIVLLILTLTFLSTWLASRFVIPIEKLKAGIGNLRSGNFNKIDLKGNDEFADLALQFNGMVEELKTNKEALIIANQKNEKLLYNFIPETIAKRLLAGEQNIVENHPNASLIIIDIEDFTDLESEMGEKEAILKLNELIDSFDNAAKRFHIEKIRTLGDNYYGSCGLFTPRLDHAKRIVDFAIELRYILKQFNTTYQLNLTMLFGINTGSVTSGIVGKEHFNYDLLGETVNQLFNIRDLNIANEILVAEKVFQATEDFFEYEQIETSLQLPIYKLVSTVLAHEAKENNTIGNLKN